MPLPLTSPYPSPRLADGRYAYIMKLRDEAPAIGTGVVRWEDVCWGMTIHGLYNQLVLWAVDPPRLFDNRTASARPDYGPDDAARQLTCSDVSSTSPSSPPATASLSTSEGRRSASCTCPIPPGTCATARAVSSGWAGS